MINQMAWVCKEHDHISTDNKCPDCVAKGDSVDHPPHYNASPSGVECITVVEHMTFTLGNAVKYIWRSGEKGAQVEDLRKAIWYINREIERLEKK